jgi:hypothetical protein
MQVDLHNEMKMKLLRLSLISFVGCGAIEAIDVPAVSAKICAGTCSNSSLDKHKQAREAQPQCTAAIADVDP